MINFLQQLVLEAGQIAIEARVSLAEKNIHFKNEKDLVTDADQRVEAFINSRLKGTYPNHDIFGEETGRHIHGSDYCWIIDPIDGTTSFVHDLPFYSVSIALRHCGETVLGAVYAPRLNELFLVEKGSGVTLNGRPIKVSARPMKNALLGTGFACIRAGWKEHNNLEYVCRILPRCRDIRRCGSAAIDLAYVAAGRYDGFWELNLQQYDYAAGALMVTEAGGHISDFNGGTDYTGKGIVATNGVIDDELMPLLRTTV